MKKIIIILLGVIVYCACQNDDKRDWIQPEISFSNFQDARDMNTYKCITIGGQTWVAENLKLPFTNRALWTDVTLLKRKTLDHRISV